MTVLFTVQHPAHVHLFKNAIWELKDSGEEVFVYARDTDITTSLLQTYEIDYTTLAGDFDSLAGLLKTQAVYETRLLKEALEINPDVMVAMGEPAVSHVATVVGAESLIFTDTEHATLQNKLAFPLADHICTPECYCDEIGDKQIRYPGYHELAYLHPDRFTPKRKVLERNGIDPNSKFVVLRLVSWGAAHDRGESGIEDVTDVVSELENTGADVWITSEATLPPELESHRIRVPPEEIHHVLQYADLFIGESATMAAESAVLGTPALYISSIELGYLEELEERYQLVFSFSGENRHQQGLENALGIINDSNSEKWSRRRTNMLEEKTDTTDFILERIHEASK